MLGSAAVGKTSLCSQIMSSENINTYDNLENNCDVEREVVVEVDNVASNIVFTDISADQLEVIMSLKMQS